MTTETATMGSPLKTLKDLPKSIITHKPFVIFRPNIKEKDGKNYAIMDYLYFYKNLIVTSPYRNGQYFDEMPAANQLSFEALDFDKSVKRMVISNTYYFNVELESNKLLFRMNASEEVIKAYNKANPKNPIAQKEFVHEKDAVLFFDDECEVVIPPPPKD